MTTPTAELSVTPGNTSLAFSANSGFTLSQSDMVLICAIAARNRDTLEELNAEYSGVITQDMVDYLNRCNNLQSINLGGMSDQSMFLVSPLFFTQSPF